MNKFITAVTATSLASGEIGKLARLKILFPKGIEGSSPSSGTPTEKSPPP